MSIEILIQTVTQRSHDFNNVKTLLMRPDFQEMYTVLSDDGKNKIEKLVNCGAHEALRSWYRYRLNSDLGDKNIRELRSIASSLGIGDYTRLPKSVLLYEIIRAKNELTQTNNVTT